MAITISTISPAAWRRTKIFQCVSDGAGPTPSAGYAHGLATVASPTLTTRAQCNAQIIVDVRTQGLSTVVPPTVIFSDTGAVLPEIAGQTFVVEMPVSATAFITMRRPHTTTR